MFWLVGITTSLVYLRKSSFCHAELVSAGVNVLAGRYYYKLGVFEEEGSFCHAELVSASFQLVVTRYVGKVLK